VQLGVYTARQGESSGLESAATLDAYIGRTGHHPAILHDYRNITDPLLTDAEIANVKAHATTPMITWQLYRSGWEGPTIPLADVARGVYDSYIDAACALALEQPFKILIRFAHEMNGDWYGWGKQPGEYVAAFRRVAGRLRAAPNVRTVWCPNVDYGNYPIRPYWPGANFVHWMALDGYNWGPGGGPGKWQTLREVFEPSYRTLQGLSQRPIMLGEVASVEAGGDKNTWIRGGFLRAIPNHLPRIKAAVWYDRPQERDWRVDSSPAALDAWRTVVRKLT